MTFEKSYLVRNNHILSKNGATIGATTAAALEVVCQEDAWENDDKYNKATPNRYRCAVPGNGDSTRAK
jgi:hypothetical protein